MRNIWTIAKREYNHYFISPIAYVIAAGLLLFLGVAFAFIIWSASQYAGFGGYAPDTVQLNGLFAFLMMFIVPALTMGLLADETRTGTIETMLTAPLRDFELVAGKWLGSFLFMLTIIAFTLVYPIVLNSLVKPGIDQATMMTSYIGLILIAASYLAIGTGISALFSNQVAALFVTFTFLLLIYWLLGLLSSLFPTGGEIINYLVINTHFENTLNVGVIKVSDLIYFLSLIAVGLFTGTMAIETRRWR